MKDRQGVDHRRGEEERNKEYLVGGQEEGPIIRADHFSGSDLETVSSLNLKQAFPHNQRRCHGKYIFKDKMKYKPYVNVFSVISEKEILSNRYHSEVCCECLRSIDINSIFNYSYKFSGFSYVLSYISVFLIVHTDGITLKVSNTFTDIKGR